MTTNPTNPPAASEAPQSGMCDGCNTFIERGVIETDPTTGVRLLLCQWCRGEQR